MRSIETPGDRPAEGAGRPAGGSRFARPGASVETSRVARLPPGVRAVRFRFFPDSGATH